MIKKIFEELPARNHSPAVTARSGGGAKPSGNKPSGGGNDSGEGGSEKKIRQAVYDIRYRARREGIELRAAFSQYMQNSNLTSQEQSAVRAKLFPKGEGSPSGGGEKKEVAKENYGVDSWATNDVAGALFKVFVENTKKNSYELQLEESEDRKYKVRVLDPKTEKAYVRYANRQKITELRAKGLKVEMTEHGDPYEGTKREGEKPKEKKKLDPVGKEDGDVDNDGDKDKSDKYILNRRKAIGAAMAKKKGMSEEFIGEVAASKEKTVAVNNYKPIAKGMEPAVQIMPIDGADIANNRINDVRKEEVSPARKRLFEMIKEAEVISEEMCPKCGKNPCECPKGENKKEEESTPNERRTYRELLKNKLRAMGMKNPMVMPKSGEETMKIMTSSNAVMDSEC
jgi:hypothetical protein